MTPNERIRESIRLAGLTRQQAADLLGISIHTLHAWLRPTSNGGHRTAPQMAAELLALKTHVQTTRH
jgi:transcriptional regulator with XRE-family HTH domain